MQFNDTTNITGIIQRCELLLGKGNGYISGNATLLKQFTAACNVYYNKVITSILKSQDEWDFDDSNYTDFPILTTDLVSSQQDYQLPTKTLKINRVEISYDGTNWYKAEPLDVREVGDATDTTSIGNNFDETRPYYDTIGQSILFYPIPDAAVTGGLKIWVAREVDYFTSADTTQEPGFDETFHDMIPVGASLDYAIARSAPQKNDLAALYAEYDKKLQNYYGSKQVDRQYVMQSAYINYE